MALGKSHECPSDGIEIGKIQLKEPRWSPNLVYSSWMLQQMYSSNNHYNDVIMGAMVSQITSLTIVYSTVYSGADQSKHQSSASLAFVWGIHRSPVNSPHKWPVTRKMLPFDDVIVICILDLTPGLSGLGKDNCKTRRKLSSFGIWCALY